MCQIIVAETTRAPVDIIESAARQNRDGAGVAWRDGGMVRWRKGLTVEAAMRAAANLPLPYVMHFRLATVGDAISDLCHPFPIEKLPRTHKRGAARRVLFHNGHVAEWLAVLRASGYRGPVDGWSDSRAVAHVLASAGTMLLSELGGSRFAVLTARGTVHRFGTWQEIDGVLTSSPVWKPTTYFFDTNPSKPYATYADWLGSRAQAAESNWARNAKYDDAASARIADDGEDGLSPLERLVKISEMRKRLDTTVTGERMVVRLGDDGLGE